MPWDDLVAPGWKVLEWVFLIAAVLIAIAIGIAANEPWRKILLLGVWAAAWTVLGWPLLLVVYLLFALPFSA